MDERIVTAPEIERDLLLLVDAGLYHLGDAELTVLPRLKAVADRQAGASGEIEKDKKDEAIATVVREAVRSMGNTPNGRAIQALLGIHPAHLHKAKVTPRKRAAAKALGVHETTIERSTKFELVGRLAASIASIEGLARHDHDLPAFEALTLNRESHFRELLTSLDSGEPQWLLLYGGIASRLCDDAALRTYARWLITKPDANLFFCFESGALNERRAQLLDGASIAPEVEGLSSDPGQRLIEKQARLTAFRDQLERNLGPAVLARVHFVPLTRPPTAYYMITDEHVYHTPLLSRRSSESFSIKLGSRPIEPRRQVVAHLLFEVEKHDASSATQALVSHLSYELQ